jgi:predicted XRE-type DNA-binding protein
MLDITWTIKVELPQLEQWGPLLMATLQGIQHEIANLVAQQATGADAIATQLTVIADEISQLDAAQLQQADLDVLAAQIREAAMTAEQQAAQIRANSQQIGGMVPEAPATPA